MPPIFVQIESLAVALPAPATLYSLRRTASAIARAFGAGRRDEADALVLHAIVVNVALGAFSSFVMLIFGAPIYRALGGSDGELGTALAYSNAIFAGNILLWVMNGLASVIRGTGNMLVPSMMILAGVAALIPLSPILIFGVGPFPQLGVARSSPNPSNRVTCSTCHGLRTAPATGCFTVTCAPTSPPSGALACRVRRPRHNIRVMTMERRGWRG